MKASSFLYLVPLLKIIYQVTLCIACIINPDFANPAKPSKFASSSDIVVALLAVVPVGHVLSGFSPTFELSHYSFLAYFCLCPIIDVFWYTDLHELGLLFIVVLIVDAVGLIIFGLQTLWRWLRPTTTSLPREKERDLEKGELKLVEPEAENPVTTQADQNQTTQATGTLPTDSGQIDWEGRKARVMRVLKEEKTAEPLSEQGPSDSYTPHERLQPQKEAYRSVLPSPLLTGSGAGDTHYRSAGNVGQPTRVSRTPRATSSRGRIYSSVLERAPTRRRSNLSRGVYRQPSATSFSSGIGGDDEDDENPFPLTPLTDPIRMETGFL